VSGSSCAACSYTARILTVCSSTCHEGIHSACFFHAAHRRAAQVQDFLSTVFSSGPLTAAEMSKFTSAGLSGLANFPSMPMVPPPRPSQRPALLCARPWRGVMSKPGPPCGAVLDRSLLRRLWRRISRSAVRT